MVLLPATCRVSALFSLVYTVLCSAHSHGQIVHLENRILMEFDDKAMAEFKRLFRGIQFGSSLFFFSFCEFINIYHLAVWRKESSKCKMPDRFTDWWDLQGSLVKIKIKNREEGAIIRSGLLAGPTVRWDYAFYAMVCKTIQVWTDYTSEWTKKICIGECSQV